MHSTLFSLLFIVTLVTVCSAWSGHVCYRRVITYYRVRRCAYRTWLGCCSWKYMWTYRYDYEPYCCCGWTMNFGGSCSKPVCHPHCRNGGVCDRPGHCKCPSGRDGYRCDGLTCSHLTACYPGMCERNPDRTTTTCTCEDGFGGPKCINMPSKLAPVVNSLQVRMSFWLRGIDNPMEKYSLIVDSTHKNETDFLWTNRFLFNWINITAVIQYPGDDPPPKPSWVKRSEFGITHAEAKIELVKQSYQQSDSQFVSKNETIVCNRTFTSLNIGPKSPAPDVVNCSISLPNFDRQLENADRLTITLKTKSAGFRDLIDVKRPYWIYNTDYFNGHSTTKAVEFRFDLTKPNHCKLKNPDCSDDIFSMDNDIHVSDSPIILKWNGWTDNLSGMFRYAWEVFKLVPDISGRLHEQYPLRPLQIHEVMHSDLNIASPSYHPNEVGMYSFILEASDKANNSRFIRRLCLYDPFSTITLNNSEPLKIASGSGMDSDVWTSEIGSPLVVSWQDRFVNKIHEEDKLLNEVKAYPQLLEDGLKHIEQDDNYGERTIREIPNSRGIVKFEIAHAKDSAGGRGQQEPATGWQSLSASTLSTTVTPNNPSRGDTVTIWVRATDITGRSKTDNVKVHFDDSPPYALRKVNFTKNLPGEYPFGSKVYLTMSDDESGIDRVEMTVVRMKSHTNMMSHTYKIHSIPTSECQDYEQDRCFCSNDQPDMCQKKDQILDIDNCWLMVEKEGLGTEEVELKFEIYNHAQLSVIRKVIVSKLLELNGTEVFLGPMHIHSESVNKDSARIRWDHAPACYERTEMWINYRTKEGKLIKKSLHKDAVYEDLIGLEPGTNYTVQLISQYGEVMSEPVNYILVTLPESSQSIGLSGASAGGLSLGLLLLIALVILLVGFLLWRAGRFPQFERVMELPRHFQRITHSGETEKSVRRSNTRNAKHAISIANSSYAPDDEIYLYGSMNFDAKQSWCIHPNDLTLLKLIHTGRFAKIFTASWKGAPKDHKQVIAKIVKDNQSEDDILVMMAKINFAATEVGEHPNILAMLGAVVDNDELGPVMVLEYCEGGQLDQWLTKQQGKVTDDTVEKMQRMALEIAQAMAYLASQGIVHKKLAARNVLLTFILQVKVTGFGPQRGDKEEDENSKGDRIPIKWTAPECLKTMKDADEKSDVWSYGIVLWEIFSLGQTPYPNMRSRDIEHKLKGGYRLGRPEFCEDIHYKMMQDCWAEKAKSRPTFKDIVEKLESTFCSKPSDDLYYYGQR